MSRHPAKIIHTRQTCNFTDYRCSLEIAPFYYKKAQLQADAGIKEYIKEYIKGYEVLSA